MYHDYEKIFYTCYYNSCIVFYGLWRLSGSGAGKGCGDI